MTATLTTAPAPPSSNALPGPSQPTDDRPRSYGPVRARIGILLVAYLVVGATACGIFDRVEPALILAPVLPGLGALVFAARTGTFRVLSSLSATVLTGVIAVLVAGGEASDIVDAFTAGFQGLLSTEWPSPHRPELIGTVALAIAAATALSSELATRRRFHLLPLAPLLMTYAGALALSAPLGVNWLSLIALCLLSTVFATIRNEGSLRDRLVTAPRRTQVGPALDDRRRGRCPPHAAADAEQPGRPAARRPTRAVSDASRSDRGDTGAARSRSSGRSARRHPATTSPFRCVGVPQRSTTTTATAGPRT